MEAKFRYKFDISWNLINLFLDVLDILHECPVATFLDNRSLLHRI